MDKETQGPIAFANILVSGSARGAVSNPDGSFQIPLAHLKGAEKLLITYLGYERFTMKLAGLTFENPVQILLVPDPIELSETVLIGKKKKLRAKQILRRAIDAIPENYPLRPFSLLGYYRDYQMEGTEIINLNEAILKITDIGFDQNDHNTTKVQLFERRENSAFRVDSLARSAYDYQTGIKTIENAFISDFGGNEFAILRIHNPVRNYKWSTFDLVNVMQKNLIANHGITKGAPVNYNGEDVYRIFIKKNHPDYHIDGTVLISPEDYAILKFEYSFYNLPRNRMTEEFKRQKQKGLLFRTNIEYKRQYGKLYLNFISFRNAFQLLKAPEFTEENMTIDKALKVRFNLDVEPVSALNLDAYDIYYKGEKLTFRFAKPLGNRVILYPDFEEPPMPEVFADTTESSTLIDLISGNVEGLKSSGGIVLNRRESVRFLQIREFFTQEISDSASTSVTTPTMRLDIPVFMNRAYPQSASGNYWMNTPLSPNTN